MIPGAPTPDSMIPRPMPDGAVNQYMDGGNRDGGVPLHGAGPDGGLIRPEDLFTTPTGDRRPNAGSTPGGDAVPIPTPPGGNIYSVDDQIAVSQQALRGAAEADYARNLAPPGVTLEENNVYSPGSDVPQRVLGYHDYSVRPSVWVTVERLDSIPEQPAPSDSQILKVADLVTKARRSPRTETMAPIIETLLRDGKKMTPEQLANYAKIVDRPE